MLLFHLPALKLSRQLHYQGRALHYVTFSTPVKCENRLVALVCLVCLMYLVEPDYNLIDQ